MVDGAEKRGKYGPDREPIGFVIGRNVKRIRASLGVRQSDVACAGGIPSQRVSDLERLVMVNPSSEIIEGVARGLGVGADVLMDRSQGENEERSSGSSTPPRQERSSGSSTPPREIKEAP